MTSMTADGQGKNSTQSLIKDTKLTASGVLLPVMSVITAVIIIFLVVAFFKGWTFDFYANILFGYYALTKRVWISVVLLGVTQTFIMIPLRMIRVFLSQHIRQFQEKIVNLKGETEQIAKVKKTFRTGNLTFLFYLVDFMVQLTLFVSIGRLFLTDFYTQPLNPQALLSFIPYPEYPLRGLIFKLPYPVVTESRDFGWGAVLGVWFLIFLIHVIIYIFRQVSRNLKARPAQEQEIEPEAAVEDAVKKEKTVELKESINEVISTKDQASNAGQVLKYLGSSTVVLFIVSYFLVKNFPLAIEVRILSGDVSQPNQTLNMVTAIVTFLTFFWFGLQDLLRKGRLAEMRGISDEIISVTQKEMFRNSLFNSALIGLGAYFITNLIPSAFELSIFTFELIAILSPLTIDRFVFKITERK